MSCFKIAKDRNDFNPIFSIKTPPIIKKVACIQTIAGIAFIALASLVVVSIFYSHFTIAGRQIFESQQIIVASATMLAILGLGLFFYGIKKTEPSSLEKNKNGLDQLVEILDRATMSKNPKRQTILEKLSLVTGAVFLLIAIFAVVATNVHSMSSFVIPAKALTAFGLTVSAVTFFFLHHRILAKGREAIVAQLPKLIHETASHLVLEIKQNLDQLEKNMISKLEEQNSLMDSKKEELGKTKTVIQKWVKAEKEELDNYLSSIQIIAKLSNPTPQMILDALKAPQESQKKKEVQSELVKELRQIAKDHPTVITRDTFKKKLHFNVIRERQMAEAFASSVSLADSDREVANEMRKQRHEQLIGFCADLLLLFENNLSLENIERSLVEIGLSLEEAIQKSESNVLVQLDRAMDQLGEDMIAFCKKKFPDLV